MKILWIEDFGAGLNGARLSGEIFGDIIPKGLLNNDEELYLQLPLLIKQNSVHELFLCQSYTEFKDIYLKEEGDFDLFIIDVNLEKNPTLIEGRPQNQKQNDSFDLKAGFYIYNQLIKKYPDDSIAFFTAEASSLMEFQEYCEKALIDKPKNTFQKNISDFDSVRSWLNRKVCDEYLILRRGIIEGCNSLAKELSKIPDSELEEKFLFYKTTSLNIKNDKNLYRDELTHYLGHLKYFFPIKERSRKYHAHSLFIKDLSKNWEGSYGSFSRNKNRPYSATPLEDYFFRVCQMTMKLLRNFSSHDLLSNELNNKDVAYFFMIAMRSWIVLDFNTVQKHEIILAELFNKSELNFDEFDFVSLLENQLFESYRELKREIQKGVKLNDRIDNQFVSMMDALGRTSDKYEEKGDMSELLKRKTQEISTGLFYNAFWHGLFPLYYEVDAYHKEQIRFNTEEEFSTNSTPYFLGQLIFADSFKAKSERTHLKIK